MDHSYTAGGTSRLNESTAVPNSQTFQLALQDKHLKDQGLTRQEVLSDGNCLFRAIGQALLNNENCHITLRKAAVSFMQSNLDTFSDFFHPDDLSTDANQYMLQEIDQLSQPGEHAGQECVVALAQAFCINILVTYGGTRADPRIFTLQHHGTDKPGGKRIHIIFSNVSGGHYDAVVDSKDVMNDAVRMLYYLKTKPSPKIPNLQTMKTYCIYEIPRDSPTFEAPSLPEPSPSTDVPVSNDSSSYRCDKCDVTWTSEAFLESHNKKCHPEIHEYSTQDTNVEAGLFRCKVPVCGKVFESINSLRSHYDSIHPLLCTEDVNFHNKNFRCEVPTCGKFYYTKASLKRHYVQFHPELNTQVKARMKYNKCFFPSCDKEFRTVKCVLEHMEAYHSVRMKKASLNFSSFEEFKSWKDSEEVANNVFYLKARKETHLINTISYQFVCNRSGSKRSHKAGKGQKSRIRRDNVKGSCKINATCPSRMFVSVSKPNGKVHVLYFQAHGHLLNADQIKYIPIPQKVKDGIKKLLYCGISVESIVADIQENFGILNDQDVDVKDMQVHCLVKKKNLLKMRRLLMGCSTSAFKKDENVGKSTHLWVQELNSSPSDTQVLIYKQRGIIDPTLTLEKDDFMLVLMTVEQADRYSRFGNKSVYVHSTHKTNYDNFVILTILVIDEYHKEYPVAFCISDREDKFAFEVFFTAVKIRCPDVNVSLLVVNDNVDALGAAKTVFGDGVQQFLPVSSVQYFWKQKLNAVVSQNHKDDIHGCVCSLQNAEDEEEYLNYLNSFVEKYTTLEPTFIQYFQMNYLQQPEKWAFYGIPRDLQVELRIVNAIESFHSRLKKLNYEKKENRRVDKLIHTLLAIEKDYYTQRLRFTTYNQPGESDQSKGSFYRHKVAQDIPCCMVKLVNKYQFSVASSNTDTSLYIISRCAKSCNQPLCINKCNSPECENLCAHLYTCTCLDDNPICKHIHRIHSWFGNCWQAQDPPIGYVDTQNI